MIKFHIQSKHLNACNLAVATCSWNLNVETVKEQNIKNNHIQVLSKLTMLFSVKERARKP